MISLPGWSADCPGFISKILRGLADTVTRDPDELCLSRPIFGWETILLPRSEPVERVADD